MKDKNGLMGCNLSGIMTLHKQRQKEMMFVCHPKPSPT